MIEAKTPERFREASLRAFALGVTAAARHENLEL